MKLERSLCMGVGVAAAALLVPGVASAVTWQVGPTRAVRSPCALFASTATRPAAGDVIAVDPGVYNEACFVEASGELGRPITLRAANPADRPIFDGRGIDLTGSGATPRALLQFSGSHWVVDGIEFRNAAGASRNAAGLRVTSGAQDFLVQNCSFHDNQNGLQASNHTTLSIYLNLFQANGTGDGFGMNLDVQGTTLRMIGNTLQDPRGGVNMRLRVAYAQVFGNAFLRGADYDLDLQLDSKNESADVRVAFVGNLVVRAATPGNTDQGIAWGLAPRMDGRSTRLTVVNNTFVLAGSNQRLMHVVGAGTGVDLVFTNNIVHGDGITGASIATDDDSRRTFRGASNWITTGIEGSVGLTGTLTGADPGLVPTAYYTLRAGAAAIDRGTDPGTYTDTSGGVHPALAEYEYRPLPAGSAGRATTGAAIDLGAFEGPAPVVVDAGTPDVVTITDVVVPPTDVVVPPTDVVTPPTDVVVPPTDVVTPPTDVVVPPTDVVTPPTDVVMPTEDAAVTDGGATGDVAMGNDAQVDAALPDAVVTADSGVGPGDASVDVGVPTCGCPPTASGGGCGCAVVGAEPTGSGMFSLLGVAIALGLRRTRRRAA